MRYDRMWNSWKHAQRTNELESSTKRPTKTKHSSLSLSVMSDRLVFWNRHFWWFAFFFSAEWLSERVRLCVCVYLFCCVLFCHSRHYYCCCCICCCCFHGFYSHHSILIDFSVVISIYWEWTPFCWCIANGCGTVHTDVDMNTVAIFFSGIIFKIWNSNSGFEYPFCLVGMQCMWCCWLILSFCLNCELVSAAEKDFGTLTCIVNGSQSFGRKLFYFRESFFLPIHQSILTIFPFDPNIFHLCMSQNQFWIEGTSILSSNGIDSLHYNSKVLK